MEINSDEEFWGYVAYIARLNKISEEIDCDMELQAQWRAEDKARIDAMSESRLRKYLEVEYYYEIDRKNYGKKGYVPVTTGYVQTAFTLEEMRYEVYKLCGLVDEEVGSNYKRLEPTKEQLDEDEYNPF
jgi:hypothetical protein